MDGENSFQDPLHRPKYESVLQFSHAVVIVVLPTHEACTLLNPNKNGLLKRKTKCDCGVEQLLINPRSVKVKT